jgi:hypothetical protein
MMTPRQYSKHRPCEPRQQDCTANRNPFIPTMFATKRNCKQRGITLLGRVLLLAACSYGSCSYLVNAAPATTTTSTSPQGVNLGPVRLWPGENAYVWRAAVDRRSAVATAQESSAVPTSSPLYRSLVETADRDLLRFAERLLSAYPSWLTKGTVTFGLLRAVPQTDGSVQIRNRIFNQNVISFGPCVGHRFSYQTKTPMGARQQHSTCTVSLPIAGGFLVARKRRRNAPKNKHNNASFGSLSMTLTKTQLLDTDESGGSGGNLDSRSNTAFTGDLETSLQGYTPALLGSSGSPSSARKWLYLCSQSMVHGYVMWRFHHHVRGQEFVQRIRKAVPSSELRNG